MTKTKRKQRLPAAKAISPSDLRLEVQRLIAEGKMPSLKQVLAAVGKVRQKYGAKPVADPALAVMRHFGAPENRESYLNFFYAGNPPVDGDGELPAELEAELPRKFQRAALDENVVTEDKQ
jgi:hypothetical protein